MLRVACSRCMSYVVHAVRLLTHGACCHLARTLWKQAVTACACPLAQRASADALVGMAVTDEAIGRKASVAPRAHTAWVSAAAHTVHSNCTASIAAEQCRLAARTDRGHPHREGAAGGRDGGAPGCLVRRAPASLQGTPQRRRWALAALSLHLAHGASWLLRVAPRTSARSCRT